MTQVHANPKSKIQNPQSAMLSGDNLFKTYRLGRVDVPVLKGASIHVKKGEWVAVLGASGSGKSTLMHLLGALDHPDRGSGDVIFEGQPLSRMSQRAFNRYRNRSVGFVFQFYHLLPELDVLKNTLLPAIVRLDVRALFWTVAGIFLGGVSGTLAGGLISGAMFLTFRLFGFGVDARWVLLTTAVGPIIGMIVGMLAWPGVALRLDPHYRALAAHASELLTSFGLGHRLKHRPRELSGGERQRVAIARALMNKPDVLLADEPTGNLDEHTGAEILDLIARQHQTGLTIVMVTHDEAIASRADRVVRLHDGRVVEG